MARKVKTLKVSGPWTSQSDKPGYRTHWRVEQVTDSVEYQPGSYLNTPTVKDLCDSNSWKVTLVPLPNK